MKFIRLFSLALALTGAAFVSHAASAHEGHNHDGMANKAAGELVPVSGKDAAWVAEQKANYPTTVCIVSGDKLGGDMGKPADFVYRVTGKPDRLVSFCCKDCVKDFNKDPEKYLAALDKAGAGAHSDAHAAHHH